MRVFLFLLRLMQARSTMQPDDDKPSGPDNMPGPPPEKESVGVIDDLLFTLFLIPVIGVFFPWTRDYIKDGFVILNDLPDWFVFIICLCVISLFGLRKQLADILSNFTNFRKK